jgi:hypothetical protein
MTMQPLNDVQRQATLRIVGEHKRRPGALIEIRHDLRASLSFVAPVIAEALGLARGEVLGVVTGASADVAFTLQAGSWGLKGLGPS